METGKQKIEVESADEQDDEQETEKAEEEKNDSADEEETESQTVEIQKSELEELKEERDELEEKYLRRTADLKNLQERTKQEKQELMKYANDNLLADLLEVMDNFDRALEQMNFDNEDVAEGVRMIKNQLDELLEKYDVEPIKAEGEPFDPHEHEGMMREEKEDLDEKKVLQVFKKGFKLHDRVLRPASVKVGVPASSDEGQQEEENGEKSDE